MKIGILQPGYLPWLGFFDQMNKTDVFVFYDDVQYDKGGWRNRNRIKTVNGVQWLTVPVHSSNGDSRKINEIKIDNKSNWRKKHLLSITQSYSKSPYFKKHIGVFQEAYDQNWNYLVDIDIYFINKISEALGMHNKVTVRSSELDIHGDKISRLINICRYFNADTFYEGAAGKDYIDVEVFRRENITVDFQDYRHPEYDQLFGVFIPYLSIIDLLFNCGDKSLSILSKNN
jgi:hypothetical protein